MTTPADEQVIDHDVETALALRNPGVPTTLDELASRKNQALEIIEARVAILETARFRAIKMTHPEDWVLFKSPDDRVTGYLQDSGCERVRPILGISIFDVEPPELIRSETGETFAYVVRGRGRSSMTQEEIERVEGIRESTEDFCRGLSGPKLDLRVRQAARANLDGKVVRELAGLSSVPIDALDTAWEGTGKKSEHCRKGRGFGTKQERAGGENPDAPKLVPPKCAVCNATAVYRTSARGGFYGCPDFKKHESQKWAVDLAVWEKDPRSKAPASDAAPAADATGKTDARSQQQPQQRRGSGPSQPSLTSDQIPFGTGRREPGAEG